MLEVVSYFKIFVHLISFHRLYFTRFLVLDSTNINPLVEKYKFTAINNSYEDIVDQCNELIINGSSTILTMSASITLPRNNKYILERTSVY